MTIIPFLYKVNEVIINPLILLMFALAFLYFTYSVVKFLSLPAGDKARDEARSAIMWGIVGMVIMFSVFGIINYLILPTFGINPNEIDSSARPFIGQ